MPEWTIFFSTSATQASFDVYNMYNVYLIHPYGPTSTAQDILNNIPFYFFLIWCFSQKQIRVPRSNHDTKHLSRTNRIYLFSTIDLFTLVSYK